MPALGLLIFFTSPPYNQQKFPIDYNPAPCRKQFFYWKNTEFSSNMYYVYHSHGKPFMWPSCKMFRYVCSSNRRHAEVDTEFDCQFALLAIRIHIQGGSFNCSAQISVLKRKTLVNQRGSFVHREFHGSEYLVGCLSLFHFGTENWEEQLKKTPCTLYIVLKCI